MRTTLTLDDDVAAQLAQLRARGDKPYKVLVNEALRVGLAHLERSEEPPSGPYTRVVSLGTPRLPDVDDVTDALAAVEGEHFR